MTAILVACPKGADCLSGVSQGHQVGSHELARCQASANGQSTTAGGFDPTRSYQYASERMQRTHRQIRRAFGADGRGIPNLIGPPGIGKSEMVADIARGMGADYMVFDVSTADPDSLNGIPIKPETHPAMFALEEGQANAQGQIRLADRMYERSVVEMFFRSKERPLIVFLDEINGGKEALMSSLQKVLTGRMLPQEGAFLNDNVFFIAAMNDAEHTSNGNDLAAAMVSRLTPIHMRPDFSEWSNGELTFWGKGFDSQRMESVAAALGEKAPTQEQYLEAATHVVNYLKDTGFADKTSDNRDDATLNIFSQPLDEDDLTVKVGQPRSWSKAIAGMASAIANPTPGESLTGEFVQIIEMNCGKRAARDFVGYHETHRDLPDMAKALESGAFEPGKLAEWKKQGRADIAMYTSAIVGATEFGSDVKRIYKAMDLLNEMAEHFPDIVGSRGVATLTRWNQGVVATGDSDLIREFATEMVNKVQGNKAFFDAMTTSSAMDYVSKGGAGVTDAAVMAAKQSGREKYADKA